MKPLITRKEIAQLTGLHHNTIKAKERKLGLDLARVDLGGSRVYFNREKVISELRKRGLFG